MGKKFISIVLSVFMVVGNITVGVNANGDISCDESNELTGEEIVASSNDARVNVTEDETLIQSEKEDVDKADDVDAVNDQQQYIEIRTVQDLNRVRSNLDGKYKLMNDIDLSEATVEGGVYDYNGNGWRPIGANTDYSSEEFTGEFDGQGYTISGMIINRESQISYSEEYYGLFANNNGIIKNLIICESDIYIKKVAVTDKVYIGTVAGLNEGLIENVCVECGKINVDLFGQYNNSYSTPDCYCYVSGISNNKGKILDCCNENDIYVSAVRQTSKYSEFRSTCCIYEGGISAYGLDTSEFERCCNTGNITGSIRETYNGKVSSLDNCYGIARKGKIYNCYNTGNVEFGISGGGVLSCCFFYNANARGGGTATNCFYLSNKQSTDVGWVSLNENQMKDPSFYEGFDFENVWRMSDETICKYPQLQSIRRRITGIEVLSGPTNEIVVGTELKYDGAVARVYREDGIFKDIKLTPENTIGGDTLTKGIKNVTFTYAGISVNFDIDVVPVRVNKIELVSLPSKLDYVVGQQFNPSGLQVKSIYNNGTEKECIDYDISEVDYNTEGVKTVTVSYGGKSVSFEVKYEALKAISIEVIKQPNKTEYSQGEIFDKTGMVVKAVFNDGSTKNITDYSVSELQKCGTNILDVVYKGVKTSITVKVKHNYEKPIWTWGDVTNAKATFKCHEDESHVKTVNAKITNVISKEPTCTSSGVRTYTATVTLYGIKYQDEKTEKIEYLKHDYDVIPAWTWNGISNASAKFVCKNDSNHVKTVKADITNRITKLPTCTTSGIRTYTAKVELNGKVYTTTKNVKIEPKHHLYGGPKWKWDDTTATAIFTCKRDDSHVQFRKAKVTSEIIKQPTCTTSGTRVYTAKVEFQGKIYTSTKSIKIAPKGHAYGKPTWKWNGTTSATATFVCSRDNTHKQTVKAKITNKVTMKATVYKTGTRTYTATVTFKTKSYSTKKNAKTYIFNKNITGVQIYNNKAYYVKNGIVLSSFNGFASYSNTWYYFVDGENSKNNSGLYKGIINGKSGWYYVKNGKYYSGFNGFASNTNGWWYCKNGTIDFGITGIYTGSVNGQTADWYVKDGKVTYIDTVAKGKDGWYYVKNGRVDYSFTGIGINSSGKWYCRNGKVDMSYCGTITTYSCIKYTIEYGKVIKEEEDYEEECKVLADIVQNCTTALQYYNYAWDYIKKASDVNEYYIRISYYYDFFKEARVCLAKALDLCGGISRFSGIKEIIKSALDYAPVSVSNTYSSVLRFLDDFSNTLKVIGLLTDEFYEVESIINR